MREAAGSFRALDATALAEAAGTVRSLNVVMLGMLAASDALPIESDRLVEAVLADRGQHRGGRTRGGPF